VDKWKSKKKSEIAQEEKGAIFPKFFF